MTTEPTVAEWAAALRDPRKVSTSDHFLSPSDRPYMVASDNGTRLVSLDATGNHRVHVRSARYIDDLIEVLSDLRVWLANDEAGQ